MARESFQRRLSPDGAREGRAIHAPIEGEVAGDRGGRILLLGTLLPYSQFLPWLETNGLDLPLLFSELFATRIGGFFGLDIFVSALVLFVFIPVEGRRMASGNLWLPVVATLACGVTVGFPLFLYFMRQRKLDAESRTNG